ncbi:MAG: EAL domain-containing protein [Geminocystis sp.]|nr:EAL domain-containing protein [Geminocystis sp.]MDW8117344.1 EAL domain-containing protein [Geminocystis sp.]
MKMPSEKCKFRAGEYIFREGDKGDVAYILEEGVVEIIATIDGTPTFLNVLTPGDIFGELALIDDSPRSASALAKTDVLLTVISKAQVKARIEQAHPILQLLLTVIMKHFRSETAKIRGKKAEDFPCQFYQEKLHNSIELIRLESELYQGFKNNELLLFYQPIIELKTQFLAGFEVLLRWLSPKRGYVSPEVFAPLAEASPLIISIGEWVLDESIKTLQHFQKCVNRDLFLSINVAEKQIKCRDFLEIIRDKILSNFKDKIPLKLEILERSLFEGSEAMSFIEFCREHAIPLVLDDFGTGYANLSYLKKFQFDTVKIDKCFIENLENNRKDQIICKTLIELSHGLGMTTVAEGIENQKQLEILKGLGCDYGQGYFLSPPLPREQATKMLQQYHV